MFAFWDNVCIHERNDLFRNFVYLRRAVKIVGKLNHQYLLITTFLIVLHRSENIDSSLLKTYI